MESVKEQEALALFLKTATPTEVVECIEKLVEHRPDLRDALLALLQKSPF